MNKMFKHKDDLMYKLIGIGVVLLVVGLIGFSTYYALFWHMSPWTDAGGHLHNEYSCKQELVQDYTSIPHTSYDARGNSHTTYISIPAGHHTAEDCRYW